MTREGCAFRLCRRVARSGGYCATHVNVRSLNAYRRRSLPLDVVIEELERTVAEMVKRHNLHPPTDGSPWIIQP